MNNRTHTLIRSLRVPALILGGLALSNAWIAIQDNLLGSEADPLRAFLYLAIALVAGAVAEVLRGHVWLELGGVALVYIAGLAAYPAFPGLLALPACLLTYLAGYGFSWLLRRFSPPAQA